MTRARIVLAVCLVVAGVLVVIAANAQGPETVRAAGSRYAVAVLIDDPIEVRVTSGDADRVTVAAVMPEMGHAFPPATARETEAGRFVVPKPEFGMAGAVELTVSLSGPAGREALTVNTLVTE